MLAALVATGCATKIYQGPTSGRGAEQQLAVAASADAAFADLDAKPFAAKRVAIEVYGLTEKLEGLSPEEGFVRNLLIEKLAEAGATVVERRADAELLLTVGLEAAGVDVIRRDLPLIYHHTTFRGLVRARLVTYRLGEQGIGGGSGAIVSVREVERQAIYREIYIFYLIGPIKSTSVSGPEEEAASPESE